MEIPQQNEGTDPIEILAHQGVGLRVETLNENQRGLLQKLLEQHDGIVREIFLGRIEALSE